MWPLLARDLVVCAIAKVLEDGSLLSVSRSVAHPDAPHDAKQSVRVDLMFEGWMVEPMGPDRCRLTHCDALTLGGGIPAYIVRKAALGRAASVAKLKVRRHLVLRHYAAVSGVGGVDIEDSCTASKTHPVVSPPAPPPLLSSLARSPRGRTNTQALIERDPSLWPASPAVAYPELLPPALRHLLPRAVRKAQDAALEASAAQADVAAAEAVAKAAAAGEREARVASAAATERAAAVSPAAAGHSRRRSRSGNLLPLPDPARVAAAQAERYERDFRSEVSVPP